MFLISGNIFAHEFYCISGWRNEILQFSCDDISGRDFLIESFKPRIMVGVHRHVI